MRTSAGATSPNPITVTVTPTVGNVSVGYGINAQGAGLNTGHLTLNGGQLNFQINGAGLGTGYAPISTTGTVTLSSVQLYVNMSSSFVPSLGQVRLIKLSPQHVQQF